jgi:hypothetical protein
MLIVKQDMEIKSTSEAIRYLSNFIDVFSFPEYAECYVAMGANKAFETIFYGINALSKGILISSRKENKSASFLDRSGCLYNNRRAGFSLACNPHQ